MKKILKSHCGFGKNDYLRSRFEYYQPNNSSNADTKIRHISRMEHSGLTVP